MSFPCYRNIFCLKVTNHLICKRKKSGWNYGNPQSLVLCDRQGTISVGKLARLANGSAVVKLGETSILATVVAQENSAAPENSFLPLTVNYRQKASAAGRIPANFLRRDLAQSHHEILVSRKIDRCLRPMFPEDFKSDIQICCNLLAYDRSNQPDVMAINAASAALAVSNIPWPNPIGAVRVGSINKQFIQNPSREQMAHSELDLIVATNHHGDVVMLDGSAQQLPYKEFDEALKFGVSIASRTASSIRQMGKRVSPNKEFVSPPRPDNKALQIWLQQNSRHDKLSRGNALEAVKRHALSSVPATPEFSGFSASCVEAEFFLLVRTVMRDLITNQGIRIDGRKITEVRPIMCEVDVHPPLHGSSLFQRGQTQVMGAVTLDSVDSMTQADPVAEVLVGRSEKKFMLHYEFPQYATGDIGKGGGVDRREIGHGALAERGLQSVVPNNFPFTIRVSTEVLESNGSSSMASICAGSLALLDAGVPIATHAAGVAMGLVTKHCASGSLRETILTDITGMEDYFGDIDYKIGGTSKGLTVIQADVKIPGVPLHFIQRIREQSHSALISILRLMDSCISEPRSDCKESWPKSESVEVSLTDRSRVMGVAGANLKRIQAETGVKITTNEDLNFQIFAPSKASLDKAKAMFKELLEQQIALQLEFGNVYNGKIVELLPGGAKVLIHPQMEPAYVRNSQLDMKTIHHSEATGLVVGDTVHIKYFGSDPASGENRWSRRALLSAGGFSKNFLPKEAPTEQPFYSGGARTHKIIDYESEKSGS